MKVFITYLALLVLCLSLICFASDMERYQKMQLHLKACAEECAAGSVLFTDGEAYSRGKVVIKEADAEKYVSYMTLDMTQSYRDFRNGTLTADIQLFDDEKGYEGLEAYGVTGTNPSCVVTLTWQGEDIMRMPYFEIREVTRRAVYEWVY